MATASSKQIAQAVGKSGKMDAKRAAAIAFQTFCEFYPDLAGANLMLEEIEESDNGKYWYITLGYDSKRTLSPHQKVFQSEMYRTYKVFTIDSSSGKVGAMKMKALE
jgi:hypothetical protein